MTVIGFHASHEQIHPAELLDAVAARRGGRLHRGDVLRPLLPVERAAGPVGVRLVLAGRRAGDDVAAVRRGQRAGPALPPGDRRPGDRHAGGDVPGPVLGRAGHRRGLQRAHHRRAAGRARTSATPGCASASRSSGPCSPARRSATTAWSRSTGPGSGPCPSDPPTLIGRGGQRRDRRRGSPSWADGLVTVDQPARHAAADDRRLPGRRRAGAGCACRCTCRYAPDEDDGAGDRARPVAQQRLRAAGLLGPGDGRALRRGRRRRCRRRTCARSVLVSGDLGAARRLAARARRPRLRRDLPAPRRPGAAASSSTPSASTSCRSST